MLSFATSFIDHLGNVGLQTYTDLESSYLIMAANIMSCFPWINRFILSISEKTLAKYLRSLNNYSLFFNNSFRLKKKTAVTEKQQQVQVATQVLQLYNEMQQKCFIHIFCSITQNVWRYAQLNFTASSRTFFRENTYACM